MRNGPITILLERTLSIIIQSNLFPYPFKAAAIKRYTYKNDKFSSAWWRTFIAVAHGRQTQKSGKFESSIGYIEIPMLSPDPVVKPCLKESYLKHCSEVLKLPTDREALS